MAEDKERGPGENVILVSRVTQRLGLPDGGLEGLAKAALGLRSQRFKLSQFLSSHTNAQMAEKHFLSHSESLTKSHIKQASRDVVFAGRCNLNRPGNVGQGPCNIWQAIARSLKPPNHLCREQIEARGGTITALEDSRDSVEHPLPWASSGTLPSRKDTSGKSLI